MKRASNCFNCAHFAPVNWTGNPTVCSIGHKPRYFMSPGGIADWHNPDRWGWKRRCEDFQSKPKVIVEPGYATRRHPGYIIGNHWLETAYDRICAGESEHEVLADYGWRQCAVGQSTTQFGAMVEEAVRAEREACLAILRDMEGKKWHTVIHGGEMKGVSLHDAYMAILKRGDK